MTERRPGPPAIMVRAVVCRHPRDTTFDLLSILLPASPELVWANAACLSLLRIRVRRRLGSYVLRAEITRGGRFTRRSSRASIRPYKERPVELRPLPVSDKRVVLVNSEQGKLAAEGEPHPPHDSGVPQSAERLVGRPGHVGAPSAQLWDRHPVVSTASMVFAGGRSAGPLKEKRAQALWQTAVT